MIIIQAKGFHMADKIVVRQVTDAVGAEIIGADLANLGTSGFEAIAEAFDHHSALLIRDQTLDADALVAFSKRFGDLDHAPLMETGRTAVDGYPEIYIVSNIKDADGKAVGSLGAGEAIWHTDMSYLDNPPYASMLYALEVPPEGGDTWVCGMGAVFDSLPDALKQRIEGLSIKHDGTYNSGGYLRQGITPNDDPVTSVGQPHPVVCAHPRTGRAALYLGRRRNAYIMGLPLEGSEALLDELWGHVGQLEHSYRHHWRVGDLLLWDNRSTMHRRDPFDPNSRRFMQRTQIKGHGVPRQAA
jgi:taurine dioxygenase